MSRAQVAVEFMLAVTFLLGIFFVVTLIVLDIQRDSVELYRNNQFEQSVQSIQKELYLVEGQSDGFCTPITLPQTIAGKPYTLDQKNATNDEPFLEFEQDNSYMIVKLRNATGTFEIGTNYVRYQDQSYNISDEVCFT